MDRIKKFEIIFGVDNNSSKTYLEGQKVTGHVHVQLSEDIVVDSISIHFFGKATILWTKAKGSKYGKTIRLRRHQDSFTMGTAEEEQYLNQRVALYIPSGLGSMLVSAGNHMYPFSVQLPFNLPSTFNTQRGQVHYYAKAVLVRPWHPKASTTREFNVRSIIDLSTMPEALRPHKCEINRALRLMCVRRGCIEASLELGRLGYLPGDTINITGTIKNNSRVRVTRSKASLIQHVRYHDGLGHALTETECVVKQEHGPIMPSAQDAWAEHMLVPDLPPTGLKGCSLMQLWYTLKIKVYLMGMVETLETSTDIVIASATDNGNTSAFDSPGISNPSGPDISIDDGYFA